MYIERLRLTDFRNYRELDLALPKGLVVFVGRNAQGKSNLLEAVMLVATSRSFRTASEREVVRWGTINHFARIEADVARSADELHVEVVVADTGLPTEGTPQIAGTPQSAATPPPVPFRKRIKINGTPRRAMDLIGQVTVVVFAPTDLDLVIGSPAERRRFLDMTLCQVRPPYCRALSQYQRILTQRAALLRRIREGEESAHALPYWDEQLARLAAPIMRERAAFLRLAEGKAAEVYASLSHEDDADDTDEPARDDADDDIPAGAQSPLGPLRLVYRPSYDGPLDVDEAAIAAGMGARLAELRRREVAQGANVMGPHRDDLTFLAGETDLSIYGSRGQQRSVALALKLAELDYIQRETGDQPILLLDDVLSELDARR
ncbi:MAG TPA: DNA replication/repair protein RecF, partial [Ktedonobacterales bacterium]|nr:DNA replication/repair protein RecF [Ktedonobacterales bacterium]